jgi:hypothetical protein
MGFLSHCGDLGQAAEVLCEADHICRIFFRPWSVRNESVTSELLTASLYKQAAMERAMSRQTQSWRTGNSQTAWLSRLIEAMEKFARPEWRARPIDRLELAAVRARLAQPAMAYASRFILRN